MQHDEILCLGEILWDALPTGLFLGGAPFNVAAHLHMLGERVAVVSRVGTDLLGDEILFRLGRKGIPTDLIQVDRDRPSGFVRAVLDEQGNASYTFVEPVAWDALALEDEALARAASAKAVVFGSLAQRSAETRNTILALGKACTGRCVFDVNLRPPYDQKDVVESSLHCADFVKLNEHELAQLGRWFRLSGGLQEMTRGLAGAFDCRTVCVTLGREGSALWNDDTWTQHPGFRVAVQDTVGAGDAFLAALLSGLLAGKRDEHVLAYANRVGAYVATQPGATPVYQFDVIDQIPGVDSSLPETSR